MIWYDRYRRFWRYPELWVLTGLALFTRLWDLGTPQSIVFDEVYFRTFASDYINGHYFFDIHPPLVKLLFAGIGSVFHLSASQIAVGPTEGVWLRLLPALAGAALVPLIYIILRQLKFGRRIATLGGLLVLLDNALLVESRFVLMDSLLLLAGFGSLSAYLAFRQAKGRRRWAYLVVVTVLMGVLVSTKWTGLAIVALIAWAWAIEGVMRRGDWRRMVAEAATVVSGIMIIYVASFAVHFSLLTHSGEGDAFMSDRFQATLVGNSQYDPSVRLSFWDKFIELNREMYTAQRTLVGVTHPYSSHWYSWPVMARPVYYWQGQTLPDGRQGNIYLLGNPVIWALGTLAVIVATLLATIRRKWLGERYALVLFLLAGYAVNFIPFAFINRPMFLYHYLFAFVFSILLLVVLINQLLDWQSRKYGRHEAQWSYVVIVAIVGMSFLYFLPLSYGWPLSPSDIQQHMWLPSWR